MRKPKQKLEQKLEIPEGLLEQVKGIQKDSECSSIAKLLLTSVDFQDVNKQAASVKKAIDEWKKLLPDNINPVSMGLFIEVLCYIFIDCDAKNPCRRTIASFFQSLNGCAQDQTLEHLNKAMVDVLVNITAIHENTEKNAEDVNFRKHVDTVCSLLENFPIGEKCVSLRVSHVLKFLIMALEYQVDRESLVGTPALQTAAMLDCLVTIKATMNVLQKCKNEMTDLLGEDDIITSLLQRFVKVIVNVLKNDAFFPDCRSAAGLAFALVVRTCTENDAVVQIMSFIMNSIVDMDGFYVNGKFYCKELGLIEIGNSEALSFFFDIGLRWNELSDKDKNTCNHVEKKIHKLNPCGVPRAPKHSRLQICQQWYRGFTIGWQISISHPSIWNALAVPKPTNFLTSWSGSKRVGTALTKTPTIIAKVEAFALWLEKMLVV